MESRHKVQDKLNLKRGIKSKKGKKYWQCNLVFSCFENLELLQNTVFCAITDTTFCRDSPALHTKLASKVA